MQASALKFLYEAVITGHGSSPSSQSHLSSPSHPHSRGSSKSSSPGFSGSSRCGNRQWAGVEPKVKLLLPAPLREHFVVSWGDEHARVLNEGELLTLSLDRRSGSGFQSRRELLFGKVDMQMKLVPGNSAGTVTTYYFSSHGEYHDEIDFEFLGNSSGNPYTLHTNIFSQGKGEREQQFFLWFDPTADFHTYSILWNPKCVIWLVDNIAIREFKNIEEKGVAYPKDQPMRIYSSLWDAEDWATQHGLVKTNWSLAPFTAAYRNYSLDGCVWSRLTRTSSCNDADFSTKAVLTTELDERSRARMKKLQRNHMVYDYCKDRWRFPKGPARECRFN